MDSSTHNSLHDDYRVRELGDTLITLRDDLVFTPQTIAGKVGYLIEDRVNSKFYRLGLAEYHFISLLNGKTTVRDAVSLTAARGADALNEQRAGMLCQWLIESGLAQTAESASADRLSRAAEKTWRQKNLQRANPLFIKLPLLRPDSFVAKIYPWCRWVFSTQFFVVVTILAVVALYLIVADWQRFTTSIEGIHSPLGYLGLLVCWLFLKIVHELGHALVCRKYGGSVREAGIVLILFLPIAYVDVSSVWRFRSKWHSILTSTAGMYVEMIFAALAAIIWSFTDSGALNQLCVNFVVMASLTTILFNANPLMRFDGYYVLSDLLGIPNLYSGGQQYLRSFFKRYFLGIGGSTASWPRSSARIIKIYSFAALGWRFIVCTALVVTAATLFHGAGAVLVAVAIVLWVALPLVRFIKFLIYGDGISKVNYKRFALSTTCLAGTLILFLTFVPWPIARHAPAIVQYSPSSAVRAASPGFVSDIRVESGQKVDAGQVIAVIENEELQMEVAQLELQIKQTEIKSRSHRRRGEMAAYQAEQKQLEAMRQRLFERLEQIDGLKVKAPVSGKIVERRLDSLLGTHVEKGDLIVSIGNERSKEIVVSIAQEDVQPFEGAVGQAVHVRVCGIAPFQSPLLEVSPRASSQPPHESLCATNGGTLTVKELNANDETSGKIRTELIAPRFIGTIALESELSSNVRSGQRGVVRLSSFDESVGGHLYTSINRWLRSRLSAPEHR